jgi:hypothetical protein
VKREGLSSRSEVHPLSRINIWMVARRQLLANAAIAASRVDS